MQDEIVNETDTDTEVAAEETAAEATEAHEVRHVYYEVGKDLLSKPDALASILLCGGLPSTIIFCNGPSEADMVAVMLNKRSIKCAKLIGHVPFAKVAQTVQQVQDGELTAVVITDVAARDLEISSFEMVVNYSIDKEPEIYLHRIDGHESSGVLHTVASLVSPLDFGPFHYLKKVVDFDIEQAELPGDEELARLKAQSFIADTLKTDHTEEAGVGALLKDILEHESRDQILATLIYNTLTVIPDLQAAQSDRRGRKRNRDDDRNDRDNRRESSSRDRDGRERGGRDSGPRKERTPMPPPKRDIRFYLGHGLKDDFNEDKFVSLVTENCQLAAESVKRFSPRDHYSFVDIPEEVASQMMDGLENVEITDGELLFFRKATSINVPREQEAGADDASSGSDEDTDSSENSDSEDHASTTEDVLAESENETRESAEE